MHSPTPSQLGIVANYFLLRSWEWGGHQSIAQGAVGSLAVGWAQVFLLGQNTSIRDHQGHLIDAGVSKALPSDDAQGTLWCQEFSEGQVHVS